MQVATNVANRSPSRTVWQRLRESLLFWFVVALVFGIVGTGIAAKIVGLSLVHQRTIDIWLQWGPHVSLVFAVVVLLFLLLMKAIGVIMEETSPPR